MADKLNRTCLVRKLVFYPTRERHSPLANILREVNKLIQYRGRPTCNDRDETEAVWASLALVDSWRLNGMRLSIDKDRFGGI